MSDTENRLFDLLDEWAHLRQQGKEALVEELCRDCPELVHELQRRISVLKATDWLEKPIDESEDESLGTGSPADFRLPDQLGRYRLDELLGEGGFGQVWKGFDPELHRPVAIKVPRPDRVSTPERVERFLQEARRVAQLKHPGIVPIHDVGREDGLCFIVSDLIEGRNLAEMIAGDRPDPHEAARLVSEVADILHHAHEQGFVHRDVKPSNILLSRDGRVFLADFGIAATVEELSEAQRTSAGTLAYMSPEQFAGGPVDARTDIFAPGVVLHELLTGRRPYAAQSGEELRRERLTGTPELRLDPSVPKALQVICRRCMATDPADRFSSAREVAEALRQWRRDQPRAAGRWLGFGVVLVVLVAAIGGGVWFSFRQGGAAERTDEVEQVREESVQPHTEPPELVEPDVVVTEPSGLLEGHTDTITALSFDSSAQMLLSASLDGTVRLWDLTTVDEPSARVVTHPSGLTAAALSPSKSLLACGGENGLLWLWDMSDETPQQRSLFGQHSAPVRFVVFNDAGDLLVTASEDGTALVWDLALDPPQMAPLPKVESRIVAVEILPDEIIAIGAENRELWLWRIAPQGERRTILFVDRKLIESFPKIDETAIDRASRSVVVAGPEGQIAGLSVETSGSGQVVLDEIGRFEARLSSIRAMQAARSYGDMAVALAAERFVQVWNLETQRLLCRVETADEVERFALSRDGRLVATADKQHRIRLWPLPKFLLRAPDSPDPQRRAAELILHLGGHVYVRGPSTPVRHLDQLPTPCEITYAWLRDTDLRDEQVPVIAAVPTIWWLNLSLTSLTDHGLRHLSAMNGLRELRLNDTKITDDGLAYLVGLDGLELLELRNTAISDRGLVHVGRLRGLTVLVLVGTPVSDEGLSHLHGLNRLKEIRLSGTRVTEQGIAALKAALPKVKAVR